MNEQVNPDVDAILAQTIEDIFDEDPRDEVLGSLCYLHPKIVPGKWQVNGYLGLPAGLDQLVVTELMNYGFITAGDDGSIGLTDKGLIFAGNRLEKLVTDSDYHLKDGAPSYPKMGVRLSIGLRSVAYRSPNLLKGFI